MARQITIHEEVSNDQDMVYLLNEIARLIEMGYNSGIAPSWELTGDEEPIEIND